MPSSSNQSSRKSPKSASRDILSNVALRALLFWLPIVVLFVSGFFEIGQGWRTAVWVVALGIMGGRACLTRSGAVECIATSLVRSFLEWPLSRSCMASA